MLTRILDAGSLLPRLEEWFDGVQRVLSNGMTLWAKFWPRAKTYGIVAGINVGSADDPPDRPGCAHCFEHIPFRGAGRFPSKLAIVDPIEERGGNLNAQTSLDVTSFEIDTDPATLNHALDVLSDIVTVPHCSGVETERDTILCEYFTCRTDPPCRAQDEFQCIFYEDWRLGHPILGTEQSIQTMLPEHLADFHRRRYSPGRMVVAIAGPSAESVLLDALEARFCKWPGRGDGPITPPATCVPNVMRGTRQINWDLEDTILYCVNVFPAERRLYNRAEFLHWMLGEGSSSPVFQKLREERGYLYTYQVDAHAYRGFGTLGFGCHVHPKRASACWADFWRVVKPDAGLSKQRWRWVQNLFDAHQRHERFEPLVVAQKAAADLMDYGRVITRDEDVTDVHNISHDEVVDFAERYFQPDHCLQVTFRPTNKP